MLKQSNSTDILAKLLATEDITVQWGNYKTAFFDVEKRVLGLPLWKKMSKSLRYLFIGHEVGHALFTPAEGWHESTTEIPGCPRSYINIVEDVRIEKLIQKKYPGLVRSFKLGYKELFDKNFFGTENREIASYSFPDRINIKAKLRNLIDVPFTKEEQPYVDMIFSVETWDDVLKACKALYDFMKEKQEEINDFSKIDAMGAGMPNDDVEDSEQDISDAGEPSDFQDGEETSESSNSDNQQLQDSEQNSENKDSAETSENDESDENSEVDESVQTTSAGDDVDRIETDEQFRKNEGKLVEQDHAGRQPLYVRSITGQQFAHMYFSYSHVQKARLGNNDNTAHAWHRAHPDPALASKSEYKAFVEETKRTTGLMAKEFEMRKAAWRSLRAQTARTGSLDVNKLHSYKYNDDIFAKMTNLADAKSHGMLMLIDYSGSMDYILGDTIKQTLNLATFCKKVGIPFQILGFTSGYNPRHHEAEGQIRVNADGTPICIELNTGDVDYRDVRIFELLSSSLKKKDYEEGFYKLWCRAADRSFVASRLEGLGGTPLNEALMGMRWVVKNFKAKFPVQKVNFVLLTDGEGRNVRIQSGDHYSNQMIIDNNGELSDPIDRRGIECTTHLLDDFRQKGITTIGYRLCDRTYTFKGDVWKTSKSFIDQKEMNDILKQYRNQKFYSVDNTIGYDRYFLLKADKSLDTDIEDLNIDPNASKAQITKAFKQHTASKKGNRVLATKFAEIVA